MASARAGPYPQPLMLRPELGSSGCTSSDLCQPGAGRWGWVYPDCPILPFHPQRCWKDGPSQGTRAGAQQVGTLCCPWISVCVGEGGARESWGGEQSKRKSKTLERGTREVLTSFGAPLLCVLVSDRRKDVPWQDSRSSTLQAHKEAGLSSELSALVRAPKGPLSASLLLLRQGAESSSATCLLLYQRDNL